MILPLILLAPMEGVVDPVIRQIFSRLGGYDQMTTEFVRVTDRLLPSHIFFKYCPELNGAGCTPSGTKVFVQLLGGQVQPLAENAALAVELGAPGIDLNFGCPAKTVNRHDGGASLLKNPRRLFDVISAVKKSVSGRVPVTAKTRLGFSDKTLVDEIAAAVAEAGPDALTVHARTRDEGYRPPAHWEYIARIREKVGAVRVFANGDIWSVSDYFRCREVSGCPDVALGRGAMAAPDLALKIKAAVGLQAALDLNWTQIRQKILPEFYRLSVELRSPEYALSRTKQWTKLLGREYPDSSTYFESIKTFKSSQDLEKSLAQI